MRILISPELVLPKPHGVLEYPRGTAKRLRSHQRWNTAGLKRALLDMRKEYAASLAQSSLPRHE